VLDRNRDADLLTADVQSQPSSNALVREAQLLWKGVSSAPDYVLSSFDKENRAHTIQTALMSAGVTLALTCLKRSPSLSWTVGRIAAPALAVPALNDISARVSNMSGAMSDTWNSDRNWKQNVEISKETLGRFTADFAISAVASGFAEAAGRSYFGLKTPPGTNKLPELNRESILSNWQRHMDGEVVPYKMYSPEGGGIRQVDLFVPKNAKLAGEGVSAKGAGSGLLIAQDGLKLDFGKLKNLELPDAGLINLRADKSLDFVAAYTHPQRFRVIPGVNLSAWRHESGLIKEGGWFAPKAGNIDTAYLLDLEKSLTSLFKTDRTVLAGYSSGAIISNEVAAKLGPSRIQGVVSVASTVTGMEPAAVAGQFRLFVRDHGDPTLLQQGGAGGKAKHLASLGHKAVLQSKPENQVAYALSPYQGQPMISRSFDYAPTGTSIQHIALADGTPLVAQIKTTNNKHAWAVKDPDAVAARSASPVPSHIEDHLDLNALVKDIVNGNLQKFRVPS
jgi:pimeloyl-ACP methyl ester carboxylesterase